MKVDSIRVSSLVPLFALTACGSAGKQASLNGTGPDPTGTWTQACAASGSSGSTTSFQFSGTTMKMVVRTFTTTTCDAPSLTTESSLVGTYQLAEVGQDTQGAYGINATFSDVTLTPESTAIASEFSTSSECGISNWTSGAAQSIAQGSSTNCSDFSSVLAYVGQTKGFLYVINGKNLQFEDRTSGQLSPTLFVKQ